MKKEIVHKFHACFVTLFCLAFILANDNNSSNTLNNNVFHRSNIHLTANDAWQEFMPDTMKYRVQINVTWNSTSPGWPDQNAHFSWMGGGTHNANVKFWEVGTLASPGMDKMSVTGVTNILVDEVEAEIANGNAEHVIEEKHWFCPDGITHPSCGVLWFDIVVTRDFPLVTMASMLGPSPDWFIGTESLSMLDANGAFIPQITHELFPYDAGILSDNSVLESDCCEREPLSVPQQDIHLITVESGELIGPGSLGQMTFTALPPVLTATTDCLALLITADNNLHHLTGILDQYTIEILDANETIISTHTNVGNSFVIDATQLPAGLHFVRVVNQNNGAVALQQIIKE